MATKETSGKLRPINKGIVCTEVNNEMLIMIILHIIRKCLNLRSFIDNTETIGYPNSLLKYSLDKKRNKELKMKRSAS